MDEAGAFTGDTVQGSAFPNQLGDVRWREALRVVQGDRMVGNFRRLDGAKTALVS